MNIIFSSYDDFKNPYYSGGGIVSIHEIAKRMKQKDNVTVLTGSYPESRDEIVDGVKYKRIGCKWGGPKFGQIIYHLALPFYVIKNNYDLWLESFTPPYSTSFLQVFTKKPVVGLVHMLSGEDMKRKYKLPFDLIEKIGLKTYRNVITLNDNDKKKIQFSNNNVNITVVPNGVDMPKVSKPLKKKHILFIGRIEINQKGIDLLVKAYKNLNKEFSPKLVIAGSGTKRQESKLQKLISDNKLDGSIDLVGRVEGEAKDKLFRQAYFVVIPSRYETFSSVALEASSYGLPIIIFDLKNFNWIPKNCAIRIKPFNLDGLSAAMNKLIKHETLRNSMGDCGKKMSQNYSWNNVYRQYQEYLESVVSVGGGAYAK